MLIAEGPEHTPKWGTTVSLRITFQFISNEGIVITWKWIDITKLKRVK